MSIVYTKPKHLTAETLIANEPVCPLCGGTGKIVVNETTRRECSCVIERQIRVLVGEEIWNAEKIKDSPFFFLEVEQLINRADEDLWITIDWQAFLPHLRKVLGQNLKNVKGLDWRFDVTTDAHIRDAYLGDKSDGEDGISVGLRQYADLDFLVIQLGYCTKNKALPGVLLELVLRRARKRKPTWLVDTPACRFDQKHNAWDKALGDHVARHFGRMEDRDE